MVVHGQNSTVGDSNSNERVTDSQPNISRQVENIGGDERGLSLTIPEEVVEMNMLSDIENRMVLKLGDLQLSHIESMEKVMEEAKLMLMHCCMYGGGCEGNKIVLKEVVMKQVLKYKERFRKENTEKNVVAAERIDVNWMKELDWNLRGLNAFDKITALKELIRNQKLGINGNSGGLLSIWNINKVVKVEERIGVNNVTIGLCSKVNGSKWAVCNLYSPCGYSEREGFWQDSDVVRSWWSGSICFAGDMNVVRGEEERNRGEGDNINNRFLNNFILEHEMVDLPLVGGAFTWSDMHEDPLLCRLDIFLLSVDFDLLFLDSIKNALTRVVSDHKPILLMTKPNIKSKPYFKFENGWLLYKDFLKKELSRLEFGGVREAKIEITEKIDMLDQMEETHKLTKEQFEHRINSLLKLSNIKAIEARKWHVRAKQNEFKYEDSNTSYFHRIASARRKRNTISKLEVEGVACFDQEGIKAEMRNYFESLFSEKNEVSFSLDNLYFPRLDEEEKGNMENEFTEAVVYDVVKKFGANKSPGPDGFSMEFYKVFLPIIKDDFMKLMNEFFRFGSWDWRVNCSFISLVPKKEDSCAPKDYRPLSLLGSAYKILSKVLANRLKTVMHKMVSDYQGAFIKGKQILDGVLIASECVESILKMEFFDENFAQAWLWEEVDFMDEMVVEDGLMISHLQFADDTLLFMDASEDEIRRLFLVLNSFEMLTGMKFNLEKSTLISVGSDEVVDSLDMEMGCKVEKLPIKYLALLIGASVRCSTVWEEVIKRMEVKLATWRKRFLSKAGRLVLIKSCLASFPIYFLSLIHMPVSVEEKLTKLMRNFLWDSSEEKRKMCWVSSPKICKPKHLGELGVKNLRCTSKALKAKWIWRYAKEKKDLWRKTVQHKFKNNVDVCLPTDDYSAQGRSFWKVVMNTTTFLEDHVKFKVKNGKAMRFWLDNWTNVGTPEV
ncbi:uncharacterized protein LOC113360641 [Papaver somniferum]|uniref:uncharacterized protein LOC113360641 n=1 Tax=Papaver somniferum TaxID=3469 RepID=UPI000E6F4CA3|nr:uncharacterized protein LOC113360641 [Papaver somniferum]